MKYKAIIETDEIEDFEFFEDGNGKYIHGIDANSVNGEWIALYFTECQESILELYADCISRQAVEDAIYDYSRSCDVNYAQIMEYIDKLPPVTPQPKTDILGKIRAEIDNFVSFLIRENCEGCKECEPRLSADWKPKFACVEEGRAKWLLDMAEKYKAESEDKE